MAVADDAPVGRPVPVLGYYTISPGELAYADAPPTVRQRLGRYPIPVFRLARLAVATAVQRCGLGGALLFAAGMRAQQVASLVGGVALVIDAKDVSAAAWYRRFGAVPLPDAALRLVLPLSVIEHGMSL